MAGWSKDEEAIIEANAGKLSSSALAKLLPGRTVKSVAGKVYRSGSSFPETRNRKWPTAHSKLVVALCQEGYKAPQIQRILKLEGIDRTGHQIATHLNNLGWSTRTGERL